MMYIDNDDDDVNDNNDDDYEFVLW